MFDLNDIEGRQKFSIRLSELRTNTLFTKDKREEVIKKIANYRFDKKVNCNDCSKSEDVIKEIKYDKPLLHSEEWVTDKAEKPLTQYALGKIIGRGRTTITAWESGKNIPEYTELYMLCTIFDVDVGYLLGDIECKRYAEQKIVDITGLSEDAAKVLVYDKSDNKESDNIDDMVADIDWSKPRTLSKSDFDIVNDFLTDKDFINLINAIQEYADYSCAEHGYKWLNKRTINHYISDMYMYRDAKYSYYAISNKIFNKIIDEIAEKSIDNIDYNDLIFQHNNNLI